MTTQEFEVSKAQIAREILCTDSAEVLEAVRKTLRRFAKRTQSAQEAARPSIGPATLEEMDTRIDHAEAEYEAGQEYSSEEVHQYMGQKYPFLCK